MLGGHGFGFGGGLMWLFWILLIAVIVWVVKAVATADRRSGTVEKPPLEILQERLARGEINEEEFERKRRILGR